MFDKRDTIDQSGNNNLAIQNSEVNIVVSIFDQLEAFAGRGMFDEVANLMESICKFIGTKHPLYPHYKYKPVQFGDKFILEHEPLSVEAKEKYPLTHRGKFTISQDQLDGYNNIHELLEDAFFKQEEIEINMSAFTTWLGDHLVETPNLGTSFTNGKWVIAPEPLPEPLKLKLYFKGDTDINIIDYLEMGVSGKEGNEFILIDNSKQKNAKLLVSLLLPINIKSEEQYTIITNAKINLKIKEEFQNNVAAMRSLFYFFKLVADKSKSIALKNLSENTDFLVISDFSLNDDIVDFEKDYQLADRLYKIEQYYNITFTVPEVIDVHEWEAIEILELNMENKPLIRKLNTLTMNLDDKKSIVNILNLFESEKTVKKLKLIQTGPNARIELFNSVIPIEKIEIVYNSLRIDDIKRLRGKLEYMDEGETIKVSFIPGDDPEFKEFYYFKTTSEI
ncbi:Uncharacterized protein BCZB5J_02619 [Bacillus cereus]|nr:Uncharacterized protein BCZB5J_02619 [Bacillus cereus]